MQYAIDTLHLVKDQWDDIIKFCTNQSVVPFIHDIQNFDNLENTIANNYFPEDVIQNIKIGLFVNARDEKNMVEWAAHHLLLGFDVIYIFDHKSTIPLDGQFDKFNTGSKKVFVERTEVEGAIKDILLVKAVEYATHMNLDWFIYLDADEFFIINSNNITNIKELISLYPDADSVSFNWLLFGSNHHINEPEGFIIENYTRSEVKLNNSLKTFLRPTEFLSPNGHRSEVKNINKAFHENGSCFNVLHHPFLVNRHFTNEIEYYNTNAYVAHYIVQSEETYVRRKLKMPRDDWGSFRDSCVTLLGHKVTAEYTMHNEFNDVENFSVKNKYLENIKKYLKDIGY
jgi:hypothetical protein